MYDYQFSDAGLTTLVLLRHTWFAMYNVIAGKLAKVGLTPEQIDVLWACRAHPGTLTPAELSRLIYRKTQSVAGLLNRMEKEGFLRRVPKQKGHPFTEVKITAKGEKASDPGMAAVKDLVTTIMPTLSEEEHQQLQKLLKALLAKVAEELHLELRPLPDRSQGEVIPVEW